MSYQMAEELRKRRNHEYGHEPDNPMQLWMIEDEILERVKNAKLEFFEIGRLLTDGKELIGHGKFEKWYKEKFSFSKQTAHNFMNVYRCCLGRPQIVLTIGPSILYKISARSFPKDLREHLFDHVDHGGDLELNNSELVNIMDRSTKSAT